MNDKVNKENLKEKVTDKKLGVTNDDSVEMQSKSHNIQKVALGPNTRR